LTGVPFAEGLEALSLGGSGFLGFRISLLLLRWPLATSFLLEAAQYDVGLSIEPIGR
jgi:hypothetical protein